VKAWQRAASRHIPRRAGETRALRRIHAQLDLRFDQLGFHQHPAHIGMRTLSMRA